MGGKFMHRTVLIATATASLLVQGCSSRPRAFNPTLGIATADAAGFDQAYATCTELMVAGKLDKQGRSGSLGGGAAVGATTMAVGAGAATAMGGWAGVAAASATVVLLPFAVVGGAWGMAKMKRAKKEAAIKEVIGGCLQERGYSVAGWERAPKAPASPAPAAAR
jgi:hypothetical protein